MRALTPTPSQGQQCRPCATPASKPESSSYIAMTTSTPDHDPCKTMDLTANSLPSSNSHGTPATSLDLQAENTTLKEELARLREERQIILDHSAESDIRLLEFTDNVFLHPKAMATTKLNLGKKSCSANDPTSNHNKDLQDSEINKLRTRVEELEHIIQTLKRPCELCSILKEETSNMIKSIRSLEEDNKQLKMNACSDAISPNLKVNFQSVQKNNLDIIVEENSYGVQEDNENSDFITVKSKKKRSKKKQMVDNRVNKEFLEYSKKRHNKNNNHPSIPFKNVTIIGDSHVRNLTALIREETKAGPVISGVCKPGASVLNIKPTSKPPSDHCYVLVAGTNDVDAGREDIIFAHMEEVLERCTDFSQVLVLTLTTRHDLPPDSPVHNKVSVVNNYIYELCHRKQGVEVLDVGTIDRRHFTTHGLHFNHSGKRLLAKLIVERLARMKPRPPRRPQVAPRPATVAEPPPPVILQFDTYAEAVTKSTHTTLSADASQSHSIEHLSNRFFLGKPIPTTGLN